MTEIHNNEDHVNHPSHYADHCSLECFDVLKVLLGPERVFHFCIGNAFKYLWRYKYKNGKEDLDKANWYLSAANNIKNSDDAFICDEDITILRSLMELHDKCVKTVVITSITKGDQK